jgi:hypothetical protein
MKIQLVSTLDSNTTRPRKGLTDEHVEKKDGGEEEVHHHHNVEGPIAFFKVVVNRIPDASLKPRINVNKQDATLFVSSMRAHAYHEEIRWRDCSIERPWKSHTCFLTAIDGTTMKEMQDGYSECQDSRSKDQEEHPNLAYDANNDRYKMADTLVDS